VSVSRQLAAAALAASLLALPAAISTPAGAAPGATQKAGKAQHAPAAAQPLTKVMVALEGPLTDGLRASLEKVGVVQGLELPTINTVAATLPAAAVAKLAHLPGVRAVVPQRRLELHLYRSKDQIKANGVDKPEEFERRGLSFKRPGATGKGVTVGIIDSGIFSAHPGFGDRVVKGLNFEFSELVDSGIVPADQWDAYAESTGGSALQDEVGHGTHVAGTVGGDGSGAQTDRNLKGVAPEVEFVSLKIASAANGVAEDIGFEENAMAAIDYVIRHPELGIHVTNNSWGLLPTEPGSIPGVGEETDYDAAADMVDKASSEGITMVFSAGNDGPKPGSIGRTPGGVPSAITVAAACKGTEAGQGGSCPAGEITEFSSRGTADGKGPQVDVSAPGDQILAPVSPSVLKALDECPDSGEPIYYCISGTSMASPHVAGVVALMLDVNPKMRPAEVEACLERTADDMLSAGFDIDSGWGMVDTEEALRCAYRINPAALDPQGRRVFEGEGNGPGGGGDDSGIAPTGGELPATGPGAAVTLMGFLALAGGLALRRRRHVTD
jgi:serine protease AprX